MERPAWRRIWHIDAHDPTAALAAIWAPPLQLLCRAALAFHCSSEEHGVQKATLCILQEAAVWAITRPLSSHTKSVTVALLSVEQLGAAICKLGQEGLKRSLILAGMLMVVWCRSVLCGAAVCLALWQHDQQHILPLLRPAAWGQQSVTQVTEGDTRTPFLPSSFFLESCMAHDTPQSTCL